jgi:ubiquinone/menaquinone biosynthesis C-methylase UbiE
VEDRDEVYWDERAKLLGLRAGGNKDLVKYRHEEMLRLAAFDRIAKLDEGMTVLDVGAGVGNWCFHFERKGANALGIDISGEMVALAKAQAQRRGSHVVFVNASIQDLDSSVGEFDLVTAITVLQHITDDRQWDLAISSIARLVTVGGAVVICENILSPGGPRATCANYMKERTGPEYIRAFGAQGCTLRKEIGVLIVGFRLYDLYCDWESRVRSRLRRITRFAFHSGVSRNQAAKGKQLHTKAHTVGRVAASILGTSGLVDRALSYVPFMPRRYFETTLMLFEKL